MILSKKFISDVRTKILKTSFSSQSSHIGSSLSIVELLSVIYTQFINPFKKNSNSFILSKGHGCLAQYCVLNNLKIISDKMLKTFGKDGTILMSHSSHKVKSIELSTGSLGHGLPVATGIALGYKINNSKLESYVLISDGELNEGSNWESFLFASHHKLNNLKIIIDYNKIQSLDFVNNTLKIEPLKKKLESFGLKTVIIDGHNYAEIIKSLKIKSSKPLAIIANTIKGKGVKFMENKVLWHYRPPNDKELALALNLIKKS